MVQKKESLFSKLKFKYRLVVLNDDTFEEKLSFKLSRLNVFIVFGLAVIVLISSTTLLIAYTPLREYIPGYSSTKLRKQALELVRKTDSLDVHLVYQKQYLQNIKNIVEGRDTGKLPEPSRNQIEVPKDEALKPGETELELRKKVEEEERFTIEPGNSGNRLGELEGMTFFSPIKGVVSNGFDIRKKHPGIDILAPENTPIKACLEGIVVFAEWTVETGHVMVVQHKGNVISVYKHNSARLKEQGDLVKAGEAIAIIGNSGEYSTGTHLHFELWHLGNAVDPEKFMRF